MLAGALAELPCNVRREFCIGRLVHHLAEGLLDLLIRDDAQEGRLFQLYGKPLSQSTVEHRIAGRVGEVGEDDGVLVRERMSLAGKKKPGADGQSDEHYCCAGEPSTKPSGFRGASTRPGLSSRSTETGI